MAYPPWALFPFEAAFLSFLAVRPSFDDALHHRGLHVCVPSHSCASHPFARNHLRVGETSLRAVSSSCALATRVASGIRRIPRRAASSCEGAAQVGRVPVAFFDIAAVENFGLAEHHPVSFLRTDRRCSLLVWCSFGHHSLANTARYLPEASKPASRGYHPSSFPCGCERMTRTHQVVSGGFS